VKVALPSEKVAEALEQLSKLDANAGLLSKAVSLIDMRVQGQMTVSVLEITNTKVTAPLGEKLAQKQ
jgi:cell division septal protein FtsQ